MDDNMDKLTLRGLSRKLNKIIEELNDAVDRAPDSVSEDMNNALVAAQNALVSVNEKIERKPVRRQTSQKDKDTKARNDQEIEEWWNKIWDDALEKARIRRDIDPNWPVPGVDY